LSSFIPASLQALAGRQRLWDGDVFTCSDYITTVMGDSVFNNGFNIWMAQFDEQETLQVDAYLRQAGFPQILLNFTPFCWTLFGNSSVVAGPAYGRERCSFG
jgi:hypothetical protein